jgi:hypothetical protein
MNRRFWHRGLLHGQVRASTKRLRCDLRNHLSDRRNGRIFGCLDRRTLTANQRMQRATDRIDIDLPRIELPGAITGEPPTPLVSSAMQLHEAIRVLRERKDYAAG